MTKEIPLGRGHVAKVDEQDGKRVHLGTFGSAEDAARAYDSAALTHYGPFARTNFPAQEIA